MFTNHPEAKIHNLSKGFGKKVILDQLSLDIYPGTCTGILGEKRVRKSLHLYLFWQGTVKADQGSFFLRDKDLFKEPGLRRKHVGYVPQGTPLMDELTAMDHLRLWYPGKKEIYKELEDGVLGMLGIGDFLKGSCVPHVRRNEKTSEHWLRCGGSSGNPFAGRAVGGPGSDLQGADQRVFIPV